MVQPPPPAANPDGLLEIPVGIEELQASCSHLSGDCQM
jgi:hypothetical protein